MGKIRGVVPLSVKPAPLCAACGTASPPRRSTVLEGVTICPVCYCDAFADNRLDLLLERVAPRKHEEK